MLRNLCIYQLIYMINYAKWKGSKFLDWHCLRHCSHDLTIPPFDKQENILSLWKQFSNIVLVQSQYCGFQYL